MSNIINLLRTAKAYNESFIQSQSIDDINTYKQLDPRLKKRKYINNVKTEDAKVIVKSIMPDILEVILDRSTIIPKFPSDSPQEMIKIKKSIQDYLELKVFKNPNYIISHYKAIKAAAILKYGVVKVLWDEEIKTLKIQFNGEDEYQAILEQYQGLDATISVENDMESGINTAVIKIPVKSEPDFAFVDIADFFYIPDGDTINSSSFIAHRARMTVGRINQLVDSGIYNMVEVEEDEDGNIIRNISWEEAYSKYDNPWDQYSNSDNMSYKMTAESEKPQDMRLCDVYECYTSEYDEDGNKNDIIVTVIGNRIVRKEINTYGTYPFAIYQYDFDIANIEADSMSSELKNIQSTRTNFLRLLMDNIYQNNRAKKIIDPVAYATGRIRLSDFNKENQDYVIADPNAIDSDKLRPQQLPADNYRVIEMLQREAEKRTGMTTYQQGIPIASQRETATGVTTLLQQSQKRLKLIIRLFMETGFSNLLKVLSAMMRINGILPDDVYLTSESGLGYKDNLIELQKVREISQPILGYISFLANINPQMALDTYNGYIKFILSKYDMPSDFIDHMTNFQQQLVERTQTDENTMGGINGGEQNM